MVNAVIMQLSQQAVNAGSDPDGSVQGPLAVVNPLSIANLSKLSLIQIHPLSAGVVLHPPESTGNRQQLGIQTLIPEERELQLGEGCIECLSLIHISEPTDRG